MGNRRTPDLIATLEIFRDSSLNSPIQGERWEAVLRAKGESFLCWIEPIDRPAMVGQEFLAKIYLLDPDHSLPILCTSKKFDILSDKVVGHGMVDKQTPAPGGRS